MDIFNKIMNSLRKEIGKILTKFDTINSTIKKQDEVIKELNDNYEDQNLKVSGLESEN